jgi:hypothetical protein
MLGGLIILCWFIWWVYTETVAKTNMTDLKLIYLACDLKSLESWMTGGGWGTSHLIPIVMNLTVQLLGAIEKFIFIIAIIDDAFSSRLVLQLKSACSCEIINEVNLIQTRFTILKIIRQFSIQLKLKQ